MPILEMLEDCTRYRICGFLFQEFREDAAISIFRRQLILLRDCPSKHIRSDRQKHESLDSIIILWLRHKGAKNINTILQSLYCSVLKIQEVDRHFSIFLFHNWPFRHIQSPPSPILHHVFISNIDPRNRQARTSSSRFSGTSPSPRGQEDCSSPSYYHTFPLPPPRPSPRDDQATTDKNV